MSNKIRAAVSLISCGGDFLILKRSIHEQDPWSGQLSLPGGRIDPEDLNPLSAALRETREECGIEIKSTHKFIELDAQQAGGNVNSAMWVRPFYFQLAEKPVITLDQREHAEYFWVSEAYLRNQQNHYQKRKSKHYPHTDFWCADICGNDLWGFTYNLVMDFLAKSS